MTLDLTKGMSLDLTKTQTEVFEIAVSWKPATTGVDIDVDTSAFLMHESGGLKKLTAIQNVVFFNAPKHVSGAVSLSGDSRDGKADGDDEVIYVDTSKIPSDVAQVSVYINIFAPKVSFGTIKEAKAVVRTKSGNTLATFNMSTDFNTENCILVGVVSKINGNWSFTAEGEGYYMESVTKDDGSVVEGLNLIVESLAKGV